MPTPRGRPGTGWELGGSAPVGDLGVGYRIRVSAGGPGNPAARDGERVGARDRTSVGPGHTGSDR